ADEFQALAVRSLAGSPLYAEVARHARDWNKLGNVGLVVGAADPAAMAQVRALAPELWFLVPGIGAQGGDLQAVLAAGLRLMALGLSSTPRAALSAPLTPQPKPGISATKCALPAGRFVPHRVIYHPPQVLPRRGPWRMRFSLLAA